MPQGMTPRTSLVGKLEDLSLGEILQIVSLSQRSGVLRLEGPKGDAHIFIRDGKIIHATHSAAHEGLFAFLLQKRLVDPARLEDFKGRLREGMDPAELGQILSRDLGVSQQSFQTALKSRVEELVYSFFFWEEGTFSFELVDVKDADPFLRKSAFFLDEGINPQFLVMEGARRKDEINRGNLGTAAITPHIGEGTGERIPVTVQEDLLAREVEGFHLPDSQPALPERTARVVIMVVESPHIRATLKEHLEKEKVNVLTFPDAATALTGIQDLRSRGIHPFLVLDLRAKALTDGVLLGGLEILSTLWDLGFNLPALLVSDAAVPPGLREKLSGLASVEVAMTKDEGDAAAVLERILQSLAPKGKRKRTDFYDIREDFASELAEIDLPLNEWQEPARETNAPPDDPHMEKLRFYVGELSRPGAGGEITLLALRFASECTSRAVLFLVRREDLKGLGQVGIDLGPGCDPNRAVQEMVIPLTAGSIFSRVVSTQQSYRGVPTGSPEEKKLFKAMGGGIPREVYLGPIVSMGKTAVLLYGDDCPEGRGLSTTQAMDIFLSHVGLALDRAFLEMKLGARRA